MQKKPTSQKATTTRAAVATTQKDAPTRAELVRGLADGASRLSAVEEKVLRMGHGVGAPRTLVLERRQSRARASAAAQPRVAPPAIVEVAPANPKRDRIVAALKSRKPAR
jgi:hypothetical protein